MKSRSSRVLRQVVLVVVAVCLLAAAAAGVPAKKKKKKKGGEDEALPVASASAAPSASAPPTPAPSAAPAPAPDPDAAKKEEALRRFEQGRLLLKEKAYDAALAEFLRSRELFPSRGNTQNAALCLSNLRRYDEALDMLERLLKEFPSLPEETRRSTEAELTRLRALVGTVEIHGAQPGATIVIDGRDRGRYPLGAPARVAAGSHVVRVYKAGFIPFEGRVEVAGGQTASLTAMLSPLTQAGRLKLLEQNGRAADVLVDNVVVGRTPFDGSLAVGKHVVSLRGEGKLGTQPAAVSIKLDQQVTLTLALEALDARLRVQPEPADAAVFVDGVAVGNGSWEGGLRVGDHRIEVVAEGFVAAQRALSLRKGEDKALTVRLERDPNSPLWRKSAPQGVFLEGFAGLVLTTSLGGEIADACTGGCSATLPLGGLFRASAGYQLGSGLRFGLDAGYLAIGSKLRDRPVTARAVPSGNPTEAGSADDRLAMRGLVIGGHAAYGFGDKWLVGLRLGVGVWLARMNDLRSGSFPSGAVDPIEESTPARYVYVAPELSLGYALGKHFEVGAALDFVALVALTEPSWEDQEPVFVPSLGLADFGEQTNAGSSLFLLSPGLRARYRF